MHDSYLVFESAGYHFALPMSVVDNVSDHVHDDAISFCEYFFQQEEEEPFCIVLQTGKSIKVHNFYEILSPKDNVLPIPGFILNEAGWTRGILWDHSPRILVLNESAFLEK